MANTHIVSDHESRIPAQYVREGALNYADTPALWTRKRDYAMAIAQDGLGVGTELGVSSHEPGDKCYRAIVKAAKAAWLAVDPRALFAEFPQFVRYHAPALADALAAEVATVAAVVTPAPAPKAKAPVKAAPVKRSLAVESVAALAPMGPVAAPASDTRLDAIEATLAGITSTIGTLAQLVASLLPAPAPAPAPVAPSVAALASMAPKAKAPAAPVKRTRLPEQGPRERAAAANALVASKGTTRASTLAPGNRNN